MKVSVDWLKDFIQTDISYSALIDKMNKIGLLVDAWEEKEGDVILELETYANRPDTLGHLGVAREISVVLGIPLQDKSWPLIEGTEQISECFDVQIWDEHLCPRYCGVIVRGVKVGPSPDWLAKRIRAMGLNPVNNVVDVSNYVLFATGHPVHTFDLTKLTGDKIIVRKAGKKETLLTLDNQRISLSPEMLVIADEKRPVALAGIIGGEESAVNESTQDVFIESAHFDPVSIRKTRKIGGIQTDASYRFERGADISFPPKAALMVASLLTQMGGKAAKGILDIYPKPRKAKTVVLRHHRIAELLGIDIEKEFVEDILSREEFQVENQQNGIWRIKVPYARVDIEREADLIEELARFYGYEKIPSHLPNISPLTLGIGRKEDVLNRVRQLLFHEGYDEVVNFSFSNPDKEARFQSERKAIEIRNPISSEASVLKTSLAGGLLDNIVWNRNRGAEGVHIFEIGNIFFWKEDIKTEQLSLALATFGPLEPPHWQKRMEETDFFHLKGTCEALLRSLQYESFIFQEEDFPFFEPGHSLSLSVKGEKIGYLGCLRSEILAAYDLKSPVWAAEINLAMLFSKQPQPFRLSPVIRFPSVVRDISFIIDKSVRYQQLVETIRKLSLPYLEDFCLYDKFSGSSVPQNKISLSIRFIFRHQQRTLLAEDVDKLLSRIIKALENSFNFQLREGEEN